MVIKFFAFALNSSTTIALNLSTSLKSGRRLGYFHTIASRITCTSFIGLTIFSNSSNAPSISIAPATVFTLLSALITFSISAFCTATKFPAFALNSSTAIIPNSSTSFKPGFSLEYFPFVATRIGCISLITLTTFSNSTKALAISTAPAIVFTLLSALIIFSISTFFAANKSEILVLNSLSLTSYVASAAAICVSAFIRIGIPLAILSCTTFASRRAFLASCNATKASIIFRGVAVSALLISADFLVTISILLEIAIRLTSSLIITLFSSTNPFSSLFQISLSLTLL